MQYIRLVPALTSNTTTSGYVNMQSIASNTKTVDETTAVAGSKRVHVSCSTAETVLHNFDDLYTPAHLHLQV